MGRRGRVFSRRRDPRNDLTSPRNYPGSCSQQRSTASSGPRRPCAYNWLRGPATTEIDSPHLRGGLRLNRRVFPILSKSPSADVNAWEFTGDRCGNRVGIWELDQNSLRSMTSGGAVAPVREPRPYNVICHTRMRGLPRSRCHSPRPRDITSQTRTRNAAGARCHSPPGR